MRIDVCIHSTEAKDDIKFDKIEAIGNVQMYLLCIICVAIKILIFSSLAMRMGTN
jgi:hypothetical protein